MSNYNYNFRTPNMQDTQFNTIHAGYDSSCNQNSCPIYTPTPGNHSVINSTKSKSGVSEGPSSYQVPDIMITNATATDMPSMPDMESRFIDSSVRWDDTPPSTIKDESSVKSDGIDMLSVVISTVMLMASKVPNIPEDYYAWTYRYLNCVRNRQGQHPPNIKKILTMIRHKDDGKNDDDCSCPFTTPEKRYR